MKSIESSTVPGKEVIRELYHHTSKRAAKKILRGSFVSPHADNSVHFSDVPHGEAGWRGPVAVQVFIPASLTKLTSFTITLEGATESWYTVPADQLKRKHIRGIK